jgi:hypothetical protein
MNPFIVYDDNVLRTHIAITVTLIFHNIALASASLNTTLRGGGTETLFTIAQPEATGS